MRWKGAGENGLDPWQTYWVDYYEDLTVSPNASIRVIKAAYRILALDHHPDGGTYADAERMTRINVAFNVLADQVTRARYDQLHRLRQPRPVANVQPPPSNARTSQGWPPREPHPANKPFIRVSSRKSWDDLLSFGVLMAGMFGLLIAVLIMIAMQ